MPYVEEWLAKFITKDDVIGFDPNLTSYSTFTKYSKVNFYVHRRGLENVGYH